MKRIRPSRWSGQLLHARSGAAIPRRPFFLDTAVRCQSSTAAPAHDLVEDIPLQSTLRPLPSPPPERALQSAKLAALHARLSLSKKIPLQTLARALVTASADPNASFNNQNLAYLGTTIINYHVLEYLICKWPRLPMPILYEALRAYSGPDALSYIVRRWGTEEAAAPGEEVDPGLLQWSPEPQSQADRRWGGYVRTDRKDIYRRGMSSRVVLDDDFGDKVQVPTKDKAAYDRLQNESFASFAQAVVGALYAHCGRESAKAFVESHILSRQLDLASLFAFSMPTRELSMLCAREGFEPPLARLESETGRMSRSPVFIVGIYSGKEKLAEGAGSSLDMARRKASMNALMAWYMYSPSNQVRVPSDTMDEGAKPWKAPYIDIGEIIS
ncbi:54S ribosomal protein L3 mitochondrial [Amphichorda felina]